MASTETAIEVKPREMPETALALSVVIPCLNEADSIEIVVGKAVRTMQEAGIAGEVVVADNGSTDGSPELAERAGARVVHESRKGYGSAYLAGFRAARGTYILMGDADDTYDFTEIPALPGAARAGSRHGHRQPLQAKIHKGAMPWLHRYVGNPILTGLLNLSSVPASPTPTAACAPSAANCCRGST